MKRAVVLFIVSVFSFFLVLTGGDTKSIEKKYKVAARVDQKKGVTTYMPKGADLRSRLLVYIVKPDNNPEYILRLRVAYFAEEMLFLKRFTFEIDGEELEILVRDTVRTQDLRNPNLPGDYAGSSGGGIVEFYDIAVNPGETEVLKKIAATKGVKMKYEGTKGFKKFKIHKSEVTDIKRVLDAFEELKAN